jgi:hypothetical protein
MKKFIGLSFIPLNPDLGLLLLQISFSSFMVGKNS